MLGRKLHLEHRSSWRRFEGDAAIVLLKQPSHHIESQACSFTDWFRSEERIEDASLNLGRNARSVIRDGHDYRFTLV